MNEHSLEANCELTGEEQVPQRGKRSGLALGPALLPCTELQLDLLSS